MHDMIALGITAAMLAALQRLSAQGELCQWAACVAW